jgi:hypothetical protein
MLTTIDHYTTQIGQFTAKIETLAEPYLHQITRLASERSAPDGLPRSSSPPGKRKGSNATGRGNRASVPPRAKPLSAPAAPSRFAAQDTGGSPGACRRRKPW